MIIQLRDNRSLDEDGSEKWSNSRHIFKRELTVFHDWSDAIETTNLLACFPYKALNSLMTGKVYY